MSHLKIIITVDEDFEYDFREANQIGNLQSYV